MSTGGSSSFRAEQSEHTTTYMVDISQLVNQTNQFQSGRILRGTPRGSWIGGGGGGRRRIRGSGRRTGGLGSQRRRGRRRRTTSTRTAASRGPSASTSRHGRCVGGRPVQSPSSNRLDNLQKTAKPSQAKQGTENEFEMSASTSTKTELFQNDGSLDVTS